MRKSWSFVAFFSRAGIAGCLALSVCFAGMPAFAQKREGFDEWYLRLNGEREAMRASLYVYEMGEGAPVIVLHGGFGGEHGYLRDLVASLSGSYHFVLYDQRGSLRSRCVECEFSVKTHLEDLDLLRRELGYDKVTLLGHSMGTFLAMAYAERYPEHVSGLVMLGAVPAVASAAAPYGAKARESGFYERPEVQAAYEAAGVSADQLTEKQSSTRWRIKYAATNLYDVGKWRQISGGMAFYSAEAGQAAAATMPESWDYRQTLRRLPNGAHVIMGDHDYLDFGEGKWAAVAAELSEKVTHTVIKDAGHRGWIEKPHDYERALRNALMQTTAE